MVYYYLPSFKSWFGKQNKTSRISLSSFLPSTPRVIRAINGQKNLSREVMTVPFVKTSFNPSIVGFFQMKFFKFKLRAYNHCLEGIIISCHRLHAI